MKPTLMHFSISVLSALAMVLAVSSPLCAGPRTLKLEYQEEAEDSNEQLPKQIQAAFAKLISGSSTRMSPSSSAASSI